MDMDFIVNKLFEIESELKLFDHSIQKEHYWRQLRNSLYLEIVTKKNLFERTQEERKNTFFSTFMIGIRSIKGLTLKNPLRAKNREIIFHSTRRSKLKDGLWWDLYCDPVIDKINHSYLLWEGYSIDRHPTPAKTKQLYYLDFPAIYASIIARLKFRNIKFTNDEISFLKNVQMRIENDFDITFNVQKHVTGIIKKKKSFKPIMTKIIKRINPKIVFMLVGYGSVTEIVIEVCKSLHIPVIEYQHGTLDSHLPYYIFPKDVQNTDNFPDFLFTFGDYWNKQVSLPIPKENIVSVGYPYFESQMEFVLKQFPVKLNQILIISQGTIGKSLSKLAIELASLKDLKFNIVYKLHPGEFSRWRKEYPWLISDKLTVIEDQYPIHQLFAQSKIQIGVYSTALYEGLAFGLETIIVDLPGISFVKSLINSLHLRVVSNVAEIKETINSLSQSKSVDGDFFFKTNSIENINKKIDEIILNQFKNVGD